MRIARPLTVITCAVVLVGCSPSSPAVERTPYSAFTPTTVPAVTPTPSPSGAAEALTDGQRATLDVTFGRTETGDGLLTTYCPMDKSGRTYYSELIARQLDGYTTQTVLTYLDEACSSL